MKKNTACFKTDAVINKIDKYVCPALLFDTTGYILHKNPKFLSTFENDYFVFEENIVNYFQKKSIKKFSRVLDAICDEPINSCINYHQVQWIISEKKLNNCTVYIALIYMTEDRSLSNNLIDHVPAKIFWKNKDLIYQGCNDSFLKSLNLKSKKDIIGKSDFDLPVLKKDSEKFRADDMQVMLSKKAKLNIEESQVLSNGNIQHLLTSKVPIFDKKNNVIGIIAIYADITHLKNIERKLKITTKKAEAADKAKAEFISNMSHDIRTPLTGIIGLSAMVESESQEENIKKYAQMLNISGEQLLSLLNSVLDIVASDSIGKKSLRISTFNLEDLLRSIFELELPYLELKSIDFNLDMDEKIPPFIASDKEKIYRIILNILSNAIKFTDTGSITIKARLISQKEDEIFVKIQIIDTGIGIPKEDVNKVFDQFFRANPAYEGKFDGYGVGLHIVQKYLNLLKGSVLVESELGKGTCISLTLPLKKSSQPENYTKLKPLTKNEQKVLQPQITNLECIENPIAQVLLVEDNVMARMVVKSMLTKASCQVLEAENSTDAFELFTNNQFDFVLTDIGLPDYSGLELTKKMRAFELEYKREPIPIIALSGHEDTDILSAHTSQYGLSAMYTKPLRKEQLVEIFDLCTISNKAPASNKECPSGAVDEEMIDKALAIEQLGSMAMVRELAQMMLDDAFATMIPEIDSHFKSQNWSAFKAMVHKFKGSCLYCATTPLLKCIEQLELIVSSKNIEQISPVYNDFSEYADKTQEYIRNWLK